MARRAAFIRSLRETEPGKGRLVLLGCPYEILPDGPDAGWERGPDPRMLPAMVRAFDALNYDAGLLEPAEAEALRDAGAALPHGFAVAGSEPSVTRLEVGGHAVGIVRFPAEPTPGQPVPPELAARVAEAAEGLRGRVELVIGLSGWGMADEEIFLGAHPGAVDVLLGSGPGSGLPGVTAGGGKTLWARTSTKGRIINRLDLFELPGAPGFVWTPKTGFRPDVTSLDDRIEADPEIQKLF